jgi:hypothetical protein
VLDEVSFGKDESMHEVPLRICIVVRHMGKDATLTSRGRLYQAPNLALEHECPHLLFETKHERGIPLVSGSVLPIELPTVLGRASRSSECIEESQQIHLRLTK